MLRWLAAISASPVAQFPRVRDALIECFRRMLLFLHGVIVASCVFSD